MRRALMFAALTLAVVAAAGCGGSSGGSNAGSTTSEGSGSGGEGGGQINAAGIQANNHGSKSASGETKVELDDYYFEPTVLKGTPGQKVTLELENEGSAEHTFTVDAQGIDKALQPGDEAKVTVTIPKSGAVSFYCKFHKNQGMAGALVANGSSPSSGSGSGSSGGGGGGYGSYGK
jgi:plastocyanin